MIAFSRSQRNERRRDAIYMQSLIVTTPEEQMNEWGTVLIALCVSFVTTIGILYLVSL